MKKKLNFRISDELLSQVKEYMKKHNCTKSKALINLLEAGLEKNNIALDIEEIKNLINKLNSRNNFNRILLSSIKSDLRKEMRRNYE